jgi:cell division transport system permease protein
VAGIVLKARFPRRRLIQIVATNVARHVFGSAARNWVRNLAGTTPALGSMTLLLLMTGLVGLSGFALYNLEQYEAGQASVLHIYLRDDAAYQDVDSLWDRLSIDPRVATVTYTSKAQALAHAQSIPGLPALADASGSNPFPASLDVQVKNIDNMGTIDGMVRYDLAVDPVTPTSYDPGAYQRIQQVVFGLAVAGLAFLGLLGFVAITVTANSIKAAIHARRDEITIMQLVGAPRWMVRGPFVVEGAITGALAGLVAGAVTLALGAGAISAGSSGFSEFAPGVTVATVVVAALAVLLAGVTLGSGSSLISLRRHMET